MGGTAWICGRSVHLPRPHPRPQGLSKAEDADGLVPLPLFLTWLLP